MKINTKKVRGQNPIVTVEFDNKFPFQKKQTIAVTATYPPKGFFGVPKVHRAVFIGTFMDVIQKAQKRWPNASISLKTLTIKLKSFCGVCGLEKLESEMDSAKIDGETKYSCKEHAEKPAEEVKS